MSCRSDMLSTLPIPRFFNALPNRLSEMTKSVIASLVGRDSILDALSVASLL